MLIQFCGRASRKEQWLEPGSWGLWQHEPCVPAEEVGKMPVQGWRTRAKGECQHSCGLGYPVLWD